MASWGKNDFFSFSGGNKYVFSREEGGELAYFSDFPRLRI